MFPPNSTRYKISEDFQTQSSLETIDKLEQNIKDKQHFINKKEHLKSDVKTDVKAEIEELKKEIGGLRDNYKKSLRDVKSNIGTELFNR